MSIPAAITITHDRRYKSTIKQQDEYVITGKSPVIMTKHSFSVTCPTDPGMNALPFVKQKNLHSKFIVKSREWLYIFAWGTPGLRIRHPAPREREKSWKKKRLLRGRFAFVCVYQAFPTRACL